MGQEKITKENTKEGKIKPIKNVSFSNSFFSLENICTTDIPDISCTCSICIRSSNLVSSVNRGGPSASQKFGGRSPVLNSPLQKQKNISPTQKATPADTIPERIIVRNLRSKHEIRMDITIAPKTDKTHRVSLQALLDSGANGIFIDRTWAQEQKVPMERLSKPIPVFNVDGTNNRAGDITHSAELRIQFKGHNEIVRAEVTELGNVPMILGYTWLEHHNPEIN